MEFWAIAYKYQDGVFHDFEKDDLTTDLKETCFLPTVAMANNYIQKELDNEYVAVKIKLLRLEENGVWAYSADKVLEWEDF